MTKSGRVLGGRREWWHEAATRPAQLSSVLCRDHRARRLAVSRLQGQSTECRTAFGQLPVAVAHETVRHCCKKFGASFADGRCRCRPRPGDKWGIAAGRHPPHFSLCWLCGLSGVGRSVSGIARLERPGARRARGLRDRVSMSRTGIPTGRRFGLACLCAVPGEQYGDGPARVFAGLPCRCLCPQQHG